MKLLQKSLLFASLLAVGTGIASVPAISGNVDAQAATKTSKSIKDPVADSFYYKVDGNKLIKASDVKVLYKNSQEDSGMIETATTNDYRLKVNVPKAHLYSQSGKKLSRTVEEGSTYNFGDQMQLYNNTYYMNSKDKVTQVDDSTWL